MARFRRLQVLSTMEKLGLVPVFSQSNLETAKKVVSACGAGGALCIELSDRGEGAVEKFRELVKHCSKNHPDLILGAGSVSDPAAAEDYISYGANFISGRELEEETGILCNKYKIPYLPGCGTVTQIHKAHIIGVEIAKVFPVSDDFGPGFVQAVKAPMPWASIMPVRGASPARESLSEWFKAGVTCVSMGQELITQELLDADDYEGLEKKVRETLEIIESIRSS